MFDIVTFGSATWDIFIRDKEFNLKKDKRIFNEKGVFFPLGSKIDVDEIYVSSGGGGTNTAASFVNQGLATAYCGTIGDDAAGDRIIQDLEKFKINTKLVSRTRKKLTNHSIVFSIPKKDRTILVYRGASDEFSFNQEFFNKKVKSKWFYLAPLSGSMTKSFTKIMNFAYNNKIKVAINPGNSQLKMPNIKQIIKKADILVLNQEEASFLTKIPYKKEEKIFNEISSFYSGIFVMTKGQRGAVIKYNNKKYKVGIMKSKIIDRTGAGDSFSSGFVSQIIKKNNIEKAIQFASANATSCLSQWGAKNGILKKNQKFTKIKIEKYA